MFYRYLHLQRQQLFKKGLGVVLKFMLTHCLHFQIKGMYCKIPSTKSMSKPKLQAPNSKYQPL